MKSSIPSWDDVIRVTNASENNLKDLSVCLPKNAYILVTGVSGSGKSSLVHDVVAAEARNRYLEQLNPRVRALMAHVRHPSVELIENLSPVVSLDQLHHSHSIRSTVGTLSGISDLFRLLFARYAEHPDNNQSRLTKSHFSFNTPEGACPACKGLGVEEYIEPATFVVKPEKSIKEGALSLTAPNGYIIYSQVTLDVLEMVCLAEGFSLDIPWQNLTKDQLSVIFYGSEAIKVPFGKHTLESRMKWSGITAKPREEGYYRGILVIMEEILKRDRNANILKYTRSRLCPVCKGKRLQQVSLEYSWKGLDLADWTGMTADTLGKSLLELSRGNNLSTGEAKITSTILAQLDSMLRLGIGYLSLNRETRTISSGEAKRIRLSSLIQNELSGLIYTLDEPTVGLHPRDHKNLLELLKGIQQQGNTLICIDHKFFSFQKADYWIEIGPGAGKEGGKLIFQGWMKDLLSQKSDLRKSSTWKYLSGEKRLIWNSTTQGPIGWIRLVHAKVNNLKAISVDFKIASLNVICGVSGAGKTSLLEGVLYQGLKSTDPVPELGEIHSDTDFKKIVWVDQDPIGKSPRSNPLTYIKAFDKIRDLFASLEDSKNLGFTKSHFSFNVDGGRCPKCLGAGKIEVGVGFLGKSETDCDSCMGKRFSNQVLQVKYKGLNIAEILDLEVGSACSFFGDRPEILKYLELLHSLGLGYLHLGQSSTSLSGGEAQRIKLVAELVKGRTGQSLYLLDEPTNGLHYQDVDVLLLGLRKLIDQGSTIVMVEHDPHVISLADHIVELGPESGEAGGQVVFQGSAHDLVKAHTAMAQAIQEAQNFNLDPFLEQPGLPNQKRSIHLRSVSTHNLKQIDAEIPYGSITAITGPSGSGKTSLAFDTLFERSKFQYAQIFSTYIRNSIGGNNPGEVEEVSGLLPAIGIKFKPPTGLSNSTVGTLLGISPIFRLLFSRFSVDEAGNACKLWGRHFSFLDSAGACPVCQGKGVQLRVSESRLISHTDRSIRNGALSGSRPGAFFADPDGQYMATFYAMASKKGIDPDKRWDAYSSVEKKVILFGCGDELFTTVWNYNRKGRIGSHVFDGSWDGFLNLINSDYEKKIGTTRQSNFEPLLEESACDFCKGSRIHPDRLAYNLLGKNFAEWMALPLNNLFEFLAHLHAHPVFISWEKEVQQFFNENLEKLRRVLEVALSLDLAYLDLSRTAVTLSSGEYQRVRIAGQLSSGLSGILYVLDEPGSSLHPQNLRNLGEVFRKLAQAGNTIVFTEHQETLIDYSSQVIALGPAAGASGGEVVYQGPSGNRPGQIQVKEPLILSRDGFDSAKTLIEVQDITFRNLKIPKLRLPKGWVSVSGVSGSGKSTLLNDILYPGLSGKLLATRGKRIGMDSEDLYLIKEQMQRKWFWYHSPLSVLGLDQILYKQLAENKSAGEKKVNSDWFYPNKKGFACEYCGGRGKLISHLDFLGDAETPCPNCQGAGYRKEALGFRIKQKNLPELLKMEMGELWTYLKPDPAVKALEQAFNDLQLNYLPSGQAGDTLSAGEKQRLLLAREVARPSHQSLIFLFDEPGRGLDYRSQLGFVNQIRKLANRGHSLITIDHDPGFIRWADWSIVLGPGAGIKGGSLIYAGIPLE